MSYFNSNITGGSGGAAGGLVTKFVKTITISSSTLAEVTIDISSDISNYKDVTNDNIIIELNNASAIAAGDAELSHTYNAETGVITITSTNSSIPFASSSAVELSVNVYVAGAVQLPPAPETKELKFVNNIGISTSEYRFDKDYPFAVIYHGGHDNTIYYNSTLITTNTDNIQYLTLTSDMEAIILNIKAGNTIKLDAGTGTIKLYDYK